MWRTVMNEPTRPSARGDAAGEPMETGSSAAAAAPSAPAPGSRPSGPDARFLGQAMKSLFESADVSIRRGDETQVLSRAQQVLAEINRREAPPEAATEPVPLPSSSPPGPRVDAVLWIVLATGLLAIAGWMIAYGL